MSGPEWIILWIAPALFLLIAALKLIITELISLVTLFKKLKATMNSDYSLKSGKLKMREGRDIAKLRN